ncbi:MAG: RNA polymerase sigma factor [Saprospiraceae bacterium]|nr:RNA polymerase sigma factor [Saprospiraceae bacterium]
MDRTIEISKYHESLHPDAQLVRSCLDGDLKSQRELYEQYKRPMFRLCLRYASCRQDAEDFLQDGFLKVFKDLHQYRQQGPLGAWMRKVMVNTILQHFRRQKHLFAPVEVQSLAETYHQDEQITGAMDAEMLTRYIQGLPDGYRLVFNMYVVEGYTHADIADELGISVGTSKSQLSKAKAMLRKRLEGVYSKQEIGR